MIDDKMMDKTESYLWDNLALSDLYNVCVCVCVYVSQSDCMEVRGSTSWGKRQLSENGRWTCRLDQVTLRECLHYPGEGAGAVLHLSLQHS